MAANNQFYMPMVGVDMLHIAKVETDTAEEFVTETPVWIPGLTEAGFNLNAQSGTFYADNGPYATAVGNGEFDAAISCADVPPWLSALLYGHNYNRETGELLAGELKAPYVAIQYRLQNSDGSYRYVTLYKLKALENEQKAQTKGGSINFLTNGFSLKGARRVFDGNLYRLLDDNDPSLPEGVTPKVIEENWFKDVNWAVAAPTVVEP